jgi:hypothetical protein
MAGALLAGYQPTTELAGRRPEKTHSHSPDSPGQKHDGEQKGAVMLTEPSHTMPFGRHKGVPLQEVPASYLEWAARTLKLSSGLRASVAAELERRGGKVPVPPPGAWDRPPGPCRDCGCPDVRYAWAEDRLGRRRVRAECAGCRRNRGTPPSRPPYSTAADAAAAPQGSAVSTPTKASSTGA